MSTVITEHLWDKRQHKGLLKALVCDNLFLFLKPRSPGLQDAKGKAAASGEIPGEVSTDGGGPSFPATFYLHASTVAAARSPGRPLKTDEHLSLGPRITVKSSAFCSVHLHKIGAKRVWLCFQATLFLHAAMATTIYHHLQGW